MLQNLLDSGNGPNVSTSGGEGTRWPDRTVQRVREGEYILSRLIIYILAICVKPVHKTRANDFLGRLMSGPW